MWRTWFVCNFKLIRKALTEKDTKKRKPRSEGANHLGIRAKNLPGRRDTSNDPKEGRGVPDIFGEQQGSKCGCVSM